MRSGCPCGPYSHGDKRRRSKRTYYVVVREAASRLASRLIKGRDTDTPPVGEPVTRNPTDLRGADNPMRSGLGAPSGVLPRRLQSGPSILFSYRRRYYKKGAAQQDIAEGDNFDWNQ